MRPVGATHASPSVIGTNAHMAIGALGAAAALSSRARADRRRSPLAFGRSLVASRSSPVARHWSLVNSRLATRDQLPATR